MLVFILAFLIADNALTAIKIIGTAILGFGAIKYAISMSNPDDQRKDSSVKWMIAGAMIIAIGAALSAMLQSA